jgi:TfoX/Sxy family transcriptional regulator of competence genes
MRGPGSSVRGRTEAPRAFNETLASRIRQRLARRKNVEEKKMFGGIGFLLNGNLLVGVRKDSLLVRLGPEQREEALKAAHVSRLKPLQNGPRGP